MPVHCNVTRIIRIAEFGQDKGFKEDELHRILEGVSFWVYLSEKNLRTIRIGRLDERRVAKLGNAMPLDPRSFPMTREDLGISEDAVIFTSWWRVGLKGKGWEPAIEAFPSYEEEPAARNALASVRRGRGNRAAKRCLSKCPRDHISRISISYFRLVSNVRLRDFANSLREVNLFRSLSFRQCRRGCRLSQLAWVKSRVWFIEARRERGF